MMELPRRLDVEVLLESEALARAAATALAAESASAPPRTRVAVEVEGASLRLHIEARDVRSLRAGANSFLRWLDVAVAIARGAIRGANA